MEQAEKDMLQEIAGIDDIPGGAYNIRINGKSIGHAGTDGIEIKLRPDGRGMDIRIAPNTVNERVHIPVVISSSGHTEEVINDFYIGADADITIIAGCGIHNCGSGLSRHDGIHSFHVGAGAKVSYIEKHYGSGDGNGERVMNPTTVVELDAGAYMLMETTQIRGVDSTNRATRATLGKGSTLIVKEKLLTHGNQTARSEFDIALDGAGSGADLVSRSVASGSSSQIFISKISGNNECTGHSECDAIIMDSAQVQAIPEITASCLDAALVHEAAIGKIAGEQIMKLMTLGLDREQAEQQIINGFLK